MNKTATKKTIITSPEQMNQELNNANEMLFEPEITIINNILNYSKAVSIRKSKCMEYFDIVLN